VTDWLPSCRMLLVRDAMGTWWAEGIQRRDAGKLTRGLEAQWDSGSPRSRQCESYQAVRSDLHVPRLHIN
jgi:hypothetical protein